MTAIEAARIFDVARYFDLGPRTKTWTQGNLNGWARDYHITMTLPGLL